MLTGLPGAKKVLGMFNMEVLLFSKTKIQLGQGNFLGRSIPGFSFFFAFSEYFGALFRGLGVLEEHQKNAPSGGCGHVAGGQVLACQALKILKRPSSKCFHQ